MDDHPAATAHAPVTNLPAPKPASPSRAAFTHACAPHSVRLVSDDQGLAAFMALHDVVVENLGEGEKHFVKHRTAADIAQHLQSGHYAIGIYAINGQMIAQALVALPDMEGASNLKGYPFGDKLPVDASAVIQSVGVHPDHKKCGLTEKLFEAAKIVAQNEGRAHLVAKMSAGNTRSYSAFNNAGYSQFGGNIAVGDEGYESAFMVQKLTPVKDLFIPRAFNPKKTLLTIGQP